MYYYYSMNYYYNDRYFLESFFNNKAEMFTYDKYGNVSALNMKYFNNSNNKNILINVLFIASFIDTADPDRLKTYLNIKRTLRYI